jgi:integrase
MINSIIILDHRGRMDKGSRMTLEIRLTINRASYYISTGVRVRRSEFVGGAVVNRADAMELNERLRILHGKVIEAVNECLGAGEAIDMREIRRRVWDVKSESDGDGNGAMYEWMIEQVEMLRHKDGTMKHYSTLLRRLREYGKMVEWQDLTVENICRWDAWLHKLPCEMTGSMTGRGEKGRTLSDGAVYNYHKCLKALVNRAVLFEKLPSSPYDKLRGHFRRGDRESVEFLTVDEMAAVESLHPVAGTLMEKARDVFVFQMHTGMSYADTQAFDFSQYRKVDGKWVNVGQRVKTGVQYVVQLSVECERILEKYDWTLPKITNGDYNKCLKALGAAVGIEKKMHSHLARHSFATKMMASHVEIQNISRMLGHKNITQTQRYAKVHPEDVFAEYTRVEQMSNKYKQEKK